MDVPLSAERTRSAMRLSVADGIAWAAMVGAAESFFVAQAVHLHASEREIGAVAAIPLLVGAIGGFQSIRLLTHYRRRRPIVVLGASLQAMTLAALAVMQAYRELTPWLLVSTLWPPVEPNRELAAIPSAAIRLSSNFSTFLRRRMAYQP